MKKLFFVLAIILIGTVVFGQTLINNKNFGGIGDDYFSSVTYDYNDNTYVAVGYSLRSSFGTGDWTGIVSKGSCNAVIVKYDTDFNIIWKKNFGGISSEYFKSVTYDSNDNNYVVVGFCAEDSFGTGDWTGVAGKGSDDAIIVKFDTNGNVLSKKNFGGSYEDSFASVTYDSSNNSYIAVGYSSEFSFGTGDWVGNTSKGEYGDYDAIIVKFDDDFNVLWKKNFGGNSPDYFNSVAYASGDNTYVAVGTGYIDGGDWTGITSQGDYDSVIVKYDTDGNILWKKNFGGMDMDFFYSVIYDPDDNAYVTVGYSGQNSFQAGDWFDFIGKGSSDATIVKFDTDGNVLSKNNFGGDNEDNFESVAYDSINNNYVAVGCSYIDSFGTGDWIGTFAWGDYDTTIVRFDSSCNVLNKTNFGGATYDYPASVTFDNIDDSFVIIGFSSESSFRTGNWITVTEKGQFDSTIVKFQYVVAATGVTVDPTSSAMYVGDTLKLTATVAPTNASNKRISWSSDKIGVATVDTNGKVTAKGNGTAVITATTLDGNMTATCTITVTTLVVIPVTSVAVTPSNLSLGIGSTSTLTATVLPVNATNKKVTWTSSNSNIASVDANGVVTAKAKGIIIITATTVDGKKKSTSVVTVTAPVVSVSLAPNSLILGVGASSVLKATVLPTNANNPKVTWASSNTSIATVDANGKVIAKAKGSAIITVASVDGNKTAICNVTVITPITSVTIAPKTLSLAIGNSSSLTASVLPAIAENKTVTWTSNNSKIASVDANGLVTAIAKGSATITATSADGKKKAICIVTVTAPVISVSLTPNSLILGVGASSVLKATVLPTNANNQKITWASSNTSIATVDINGKVIAKAKGSATITATSVDGNKTATCTVIVITPITSVTITPKTLTLNVGGTSSLTVTVLPVIAENKTVTWTSSNINIVTVDANGLVTAKARGVVIITATSADGKKKATCIVTVK